MWQLQGISLVNGRLLLVNIRETMLVVAGTGLECFSEFTNDLKDNIKDLFEDKLYIH